MIHMVTAQNAHLYRPQLQETHALRKKHFVDERGWSGMNVRGDGEYDDMDDECMIYFLALDPDGQIGVSMRARPTNDKCVVGDVFPQLIHAQTAPVKGDDVWEISRIFATKKFRLREGLRRRDEVFLASVEAAVDAGIKRLVGIIDTYLLPQAMRFPWSLKPLGLPQPYPEGEMIGVDIAVSRPELSRIREALGIEARIIASAPPAVAPPKSERAAQDKAFFHVASKLSETRLQTLNAIATEVLKHQGAADEEQLIAVLDRAVAQHLGDRAQH